MALELSGLQATGQEVLGYQVLQGKDGVGYFLQGKRGALYGLLPYQRDPHVFFAVRGSNGVICGLKGNYTFSDHGGRLHPHYEFCQCRQQVQQ